MKFNFTTTPETQAYCEMVVNCLVRYCGKSEDDALRLVNKFWESMTVFDENNYALHETPYYWAMGIAHHPILGDNRVDWEKDRNLWPPPKDFYDRWEADPLR